MPLLPVTKIGNPILRSKTKSISPSEYQSPAFKQLIQDMIETMHDQKGVGLAANQVARDIQLFVLECKGNARYPEAPEIPLEIYFNPKIVAHSKETIEDWEGCLSIPGYRGKVSRAKEVTLEAQTLEGKPVRRVFSDFHARIIQHEVDHLNGLFYMDRMNGLNSWMHLEELNRQLSAETE